MWARVRSYIRNDAGATSVEYAFIALLVAVAIIGAVTNLGTNLEKPYNAVASNLK